MLKKLKTENSNSKMKLKTWEHYTKHVILNFEL